MSRSANNFLACGFAAFRTLTWFLFTLSVPPIWRRVTSITSLHPVVTFASHSDSRNNNRLQLCRQQRQVPAVAYSGWNRKMAILSSRFQSRRSDCVQKIFLALDRRPDGPLAGLACSDAYLGQVRQRPLSEGRGCPVFCSSGTATAPTSPNARDPGHSYRPSHCRLRVCYFSLSDDCVEDIFNYLITIASYTNCRQSHDVDELESKLSRLTRLLSS